MSEPGAEGFFERHPFITKHVVTFVVLTLCGILTSQRGGVRSPRVYLAEEVTDTGVYLPSGEELHLASSDTVNAEFDAYGKHYIFATQVDVPVEKDNQYWYEGLRNLDLDPFSLEAEYEQYYLYADEPLTGVEPGDYVVFDSLVCGYFYEPTGDQGGIVGVYHPILRVCDAQVLSKEELGERLMQWEWAQRREHVWPNVGRG